MKFFGVGGFIFLLFILVMLVSRSSLEEGFECGNEGFLVSYGNFSLQICTILVVFVLFDSEMVLFFYLFVGGSQVFFFWFFIFLVSTFLWEAMSGTLVWYK